MTSEQLKKKPFEEIIKNGHENLDTEEGKSNEEEEKSTAFSDRSEQDCESDTTNNDNEDKEDLEPTETHNVATTIMHDEDNSSEPEDETSEGENVTDIDTYEDNREQNILPTLKLKLNTEKLKDS